MAGSPLTAFGELLILTGGGLDTLTLDGTNSTLTGTEASFIRATASGANQDLTLPSVAGNSAFGRYRVIYNAGSTYNVVVKKPAGSTLITLAPGDAVIVKGARISGSNDWYVALPVSSTFSGAIAAVAATFTGRVTTTDGVSSGDARVVGGNVHTKTSATTVTNTTTETTIGSHSLPANMIKAGSQVRVRGALRVTGVNGTPTVTLRLKLGSTTFLTSASLSVIGNDVAVFDAVITGRAAPGAAAEVVAEARMTATQSGTPTTAAQVAAPANYATNGALTVAATVQWSAAHASNSLTCDSFSVDVIG